MLGAAGRANRGHASHAASALLTRTGRAGRRRFIFNIVVAIYNMATYYPAIWKCINPYWCASQ